jgi:YggT family protein
MLVIDRIFWFLQSAIIIIIVAVIVLMVVRLIADAMDLNPFGWMSRTVRRLSDPLVVPMRGGLRNFGGMNPNFAPLVVILIAILLAWFLLSLVGTIATTVKGVLRGIQTGAVIAVLGYILFGLISIYILLIVIRIIFSWGGVSYRNRVMRFLIDVTEPLLGPLRRIVPPLGWLDISPIVALLILWLFQQAIAGTLLLGASARGF